MIKKSKLGLEPRYNIRINPEYFKDRESAEKKLEIVKLKNIHQSFEDFYTNRMVRNIKEQLLSSKKLAYENEKIAQPNGEEKTIKKATIVLPD